MTLPSESIRTCANPRCPFCGRSGHVLHAGMRDVLYGVPGEWSHRRCEGCDLIWLDPLPLPEDLPKLYRNYHTHAGAGSDAGGDWWAWALPLFHVVRSGLFGYPFRGTWPQKFLAWLLACVWPMRDLAGGTIAWTTLRRGGRWLDVGCGAGRFLKEMASLGWNVEGIEADPEACSSLGRNSSIRVHRGSLMDPLEGLGTFDVISVTHVIEHLDDPVAALKRCASWLNPGGRIVITTPNVRALSRVQFGKHWRGWEVPRHLMLFSPQSLRECASRSGLIPKAVWTISRGAPWFWLASLALSRGGDAESLGRTGGSPALRIAALLFGLLEHFLAPFGGRGEEIVLVAGKSDK